MKKKVITNRHFTMKKKSNIMSECYNLSKSDMSVLIKVYEYLIKL